MACFTNSWSSSLCFLIPLFICLIIRTAVANPVYVYSLCPDSQTVAPNSTYQTNVDTVLSSLSSNNTSESYFYNTSVGSGADRVYGVFSCRMDQTTAFCQQCLSLAIDSLNSHCHGKKDSIVWYDQCLVRYSNESFFGVLNDAPMLALWNTPNAVDIQSVTSNQTAFMQTLVETLGDAAHLAEAALSGERFATTEGRFVDNSTDLSMVYTLAECTPDISLSDCQSCLRMIIGNASELCNLKAGCTLMNPNCYMKYDIHPFYGDANTSSGLSPVPQFRETPDQNARISRHRRTIIIASVTISVALAMFFLFVAWLFTRKRKMKKTICAEANGIETVDSLNFDFSTLRKATNDFSSDKKLGEGGFGEVYKGKLANGQDVAIKRLSMTSKQGIDEFKTEVLVVAKLQHRNLVKLLGFCVSVKEKILVYEFLSNSSLDRFLSDPKKRASLCWRTRFKIIEGIAKGLLYLHEDSRLKIVHRDLKPSNILLDEAMNPKIADFGMAKHFGVDQTQDNTNRIVGTLGYMAPEYLIAGHYSVKSDIYSFGIIVLEVVSGLRSICSRQQRNDDEESLIYKAWRLWDEGVPLKLSDSALGNDFPVKEMAKCIQIGLLCVQEDSAKRPRMTSIVAALNGDSITLPLPTLPRFLTDFTADGITEAFLDQSSSSCRPVQKTTDVDAR